MTDDELAHLSDGRQPMSEEHDVSYGDLAETEELAAAVAAAQSLST
jgi:hypothetical protein